MLERGISRSWERSWPRFWRSWEGRGIVSGRLGTHYGRLGPHFTAKVLTRRQPHHPTKKTRKPRLPKSNIGGTRAKLWRHGKTANSEKSIAKVSLNIEENANPPKWRKPRAVRKGELLRGKVSHGRPHPLSMALRCEGQNLKKKI